jgi:cobalamin biosynthesis protein CbiG
VTASFAQAGKQASRQAGKQREIKYVCDICVTIRKLQKKCVTTRGKNNKMKCVGFA